jgi:hypothetical protein
MDFKLETSLISPNYHDIIWNNGPLTKEYTTQPLTETVAQRLKIRLLTFLGEWNYNTAYGVPYWQRILGKKTSKSSVDLIFQQQILAEDGVKEIVAFSSSFANRQYSLSFSVRVVTGQVKEITWPNLALRTLALSLKGYKIFSTSKDKKP